MMLLLEHHKGITLLAGSKFPTCNYLTQDEIQRCIPHQTKTALPLTYAQGQTLVLDPEGSAHSLSRHSHAWLENTVGEKCMMSPFLTLDIPRMIPL